MVRKFGNRKQTQEKTEQNLQKKELMERPKICLFDLKEESEILEADGYNVFSGTLGSIVDIPNKKKHDYHLCLPNSINPPNLHEYDIIIVDQAADKSIPYKKEEHTHEFTIGSSEMYFISEFPETKFDPRAFSAVKIVSDIRDLYKRGGIIITFGVAYEDIEYRITEITSRSSGQPTKVYYNNYVFLGEIPFLANKTGTQYNILSVGEALKSDIETHTAGIIYHTTFYHPQEVFSGKLDPNFYPIMTNINGKIISFIRVVDKMRQFVFPQMENKGAFLKELLTSFLPDLFPELFPFSTRFKWVEKKEYWVPKHEALLMEKKDVQEEYDKKLRKIENKIEQNLNHYKYLHELLTETGDKLVDAVEKFLHFLEFSEIKNVDKEKPNIKEEDLQVELPDGLLVIEIKGIGGMPKDIDCNQISKIKYRRGKERNAYDVKALTIINHQRYLPPLSRENPPFTKQQIEDADNEERGLVTAWQLFNLFFDVSNGLIEKEDARQTLLNTGLVRFSPSNLECIGRPKEIHYNSEVVVIDISNKELNKGDKLYIHQDGRYTETTIVSLQQNGHPVDQTTTGEIGIKLKSKVNKESELWLIRK